MLRKTIILLAMVCLFGLTPCGGLGASEQRYVIRPTIGSDWEPTPENPYHGLAKQDGSPLRVFYLCDQASGNYGCQLRFYQKPHRTGRWRDGPF